MIRSQKGFTYPLTLSILITFLIFFSVRVEQLLIERKTFHETKTILRQEYYLNASVKRVEKSLQSDDPLQTNGTIKYQFGNVNYQMALPSENTQKITFILHLASGETAVGYGYYDTAEKKISKWVEIN